MELLIKDVQDFFVELQWEAVPKAASYRFFWSDSGRAETQYRLMEETKETVYRLKKATHIPHYCRVEAFDEAGSCLAKSRVLKTPIHKIFHRQLEQLDRGLQAVRVKNGVFLSWRMFVEEVSGYNETGMTGTDYRVYRNGQPLALVTDSTNYLDKTAEPKEAAGYVYQVAPVVWENGEEKEGALCAPAALWEKPYLDIPLQRPEGGVTPAGEPFSYHANDMSIGDADGDGELEYYVKWDPSNAHDVSQRGYTGRCLIDCYKLSGQLLWRLDMGPNIRAGAHYTQFMVYDFNGDQRAEMCVKTAPGTCMTLYRPDGTVKEKRYITLPASDVEAGISHDSSFVCSAEDYRQHLADVFQGWREHPEVVKGQWPDTLEECFGREKSYAYPLNRADALALADYFIYEYAPSRSERNELTKFEGFIYEGPEYLTMFGGDGAELQTIPFPYGRVDDGLLWGDYAFPRIEPCNRSDRFLSGVAYLDGERPYVMICRGYYTRTTIAAYDFFENRFRETFRVDSGFVPMRNPFRDGRIHESAGSDPVYGALAGQGNHSLSAADVDGDGCMELIYGAAVLDHDGSLLYSSGDFRKDGVWAKLGHGDSMHAAKIDPDRPGYQIFNVFEGASAVPYGFALRDAETGKVLFGEPADSDLGRCMVGRIDRSVRGWQVWVNKTYDCKGNPLAVPTLGTNQSIRWAADLTTQIIDSPQYIGTVQTGVINDLLHGEMLRPEGTLTNNGTKGNPCLIADIFGDFREELLLRTEDSRAIRIYMNTDVTKHKLFTLLHDPMYRCGVAWQNNCYNQPAYTSFYYGDDMDFREVLPEKDFS